MILLIALGAAAVGILMFVLWLIQLRTGNAAIVDVGWAGGLALLGLLYSWLGGGYSARRAIIGGMAVIWGLRLALHLLTSRVIGHPEEGRYKELRRRWKTNIPFKFFLFYEFQALLCIVLALPFLLATRNPEPFIWPLEWSALALWILAMTGETAADSQLESFKSSPANKGHTCQAGLWRWSRHPNYFFEWIIWISFALFALSSPYGYLGFFSPALILYFLLRVTGIPATEAQAVRSRGEEYRRYQQTTSAFIPWFPKGQPPQATS